MDKFNTPWRVTAAAIYTTPTDSRVYGTLDIDVTDAKRFIDEKREEGTKLTMTHIVTAVISRAVAFDVPEMNCFIRRGRVIGRERLDAMVPVAMNNDAGVTSVIIKDAHARTVTSIAAEIREKAAVTMCVIVSFVFLNRPAENQLPLFLREIQAEKLFSFGKRALGYPIVKSSPDIGLRNRFFSGRAGGQRCTAAAQQGCVQDSSAIQ